MLDSILEGIIDGLPAPVVEVLVQIFGYCVGYVIVRGCSLGYVHVYPGEWAERRTRLFQKNGMWYVTEETVITVGLIVTFTPIIIGLVYGIITRWS